MADDARFPDHGDSEMSLASRLLYQLIDEKYRTLLDESSDLMCITDRLGKFIYVNKKLADSLGYTKKELLGMHMQDIIAEESRAEFLEKAKEFLRGGKMKIENFTLKTKYKGRIFGEMSSIAFHDNSGKFCGAKAVFKDRTRLLEIESLERKYKSILEDGIGSLDTIVIILDVDSKVRWSNSSVQKYFGLDKSIIFGEDMRDLLKDKFAPLMRQGEGFLKTVLGAYETDHAVTGLECEIMGEDKEVYYLEHWSYPIVQGDLSGGRIEIYRDITARKRSEEQLEYYYKKIHAIMEHAVEGIVEFKTDDTADNAIEFVNASFLNMMGYSEAEMLNRPLSDFIAVDERVRLVSVKLIRKAREITFVKKDGTPLYALMSSIPLVFGSRSPHALCFIADITETKLATHKLRDANLTLRALNDSLLDLSLRDVRTGVYNYRYLTERLSEEIKRAKRYFRPFSVIMIDIDFFKAVNDTYGHNFGDVVLKDFTVLLKRTVRETDIIVRAGGEEFVVFLSDTDTFGALTVAQKIIKAIKSDVLGDDKRKIQITISIGVASYPEIGPVEPAALLDAADEAMYQSKNKGRNEITVFSKATIDEARSRPASVEGASYENLKERLRSINQRNEESILESMMPLVREVEKRMAYAHGYADRLVRHVDALAESFSFSEKERKNARRAALLSNLGMLMIPVKILHKKGPLTEEELKIVKAHAVRGLEIVRDFSFLNTISRDILYHHERPDTKGYPEGLRGEVIPRVAKMVFVAETFEALTHPRPYRPRAFSEKEALEKIAGASGKQLDPEVVEHFLKLVHA
jgi:diguanylate cyclase (GGDEF)-like protein/PAS domain S-box-containing protein